MKKRLRKKKYTEWRDHFPPPCLENCKSFLKLIGFDPWETCFIWRPGTKWARAIKNWED